ncbi:unnamed protein product [Arabidopsis thaliana]|uniref:(thale cress) hypothetical protein n=1 Tax=Arabidopsis thaliana TaxID=3702 RepID=A0A7G2F4I1_ARATH|nr:unnamed protein product [Arabidopsis thaliana]
MTSTVILGSPSAEVKASYWFPDGETQDPITSAETIPSALFTHLFCAFADLDANSHKVFVSQAHEFIFSTFTETVKIRNPQVKTLLSIGGKNANNSAFASMASNHQSRKTFIDSWIFIARSNGFHGLDLAWEYPNSDHEMTNFGNLVGELRAAVEAESRRSSKPTLLLTAAVYYSSVYKTFTYPVQVMRESLDWVNIIAYDFYGPVSSSKFTVPTAGLHVSSNNEGPSGNSGLRQWIKDGLPEKKAINKFIRDEEAAKVYDPKVVGHYCFAKKIWIGYEDTQSVEAKVRYAKQNGLLGYFAWNVGADDNTVLSNAGSKAWGV